MTHDQLFVFRRMLTIAMERVSGNDSAAARSISVCCHACPDENDRASMEAERNLVILLGERERLLQHQIQAALSRLDEGTFGICQECGEDIPLKRLEAQPTSALCIGCQEYRERSMAQRMAA